MGEYISRKVGQVHNRLCDASQWVRAIVFVCAGLLVGCSTESNPLAPYEGARPLDVLQITQSFTPAIQWVGGRVAAVGVNRGSTPALDESLVWIMTADSNSIGSHVVIGPDANQKELVRSFGGTPVDSLANDVQYTFWLAEASVFEAQLDAGAINGMNFIDTTLTTSVLLNGNSFGDQDLVDEITIRRDQTLLDERYIINWTPSNVTFRRIAIRQGSTGGFDNLIWHIVVPEDVEQGISPPVVIGQAPPQAQVAIEWNGFGGPASYTLWMNTTEWEGDFGFFSEGYAFFQIFGSNFE